MLDVARLSTGSNALENTILRVSAVERRFEPTMCGLFATIGGSRSTFRGLQPPHLDVRNDFAGFETVIFGLMLKACGDEPTVRARQFTKRAQPLRSTVPQP